MRRQHATASYKRFCEAARSALEEETIRLHERGFEQLASLEGRWHPNGFAVFHLDDDHELGNLRLHIWPDTLRVSRPDGALIHTHAWHLCSRILTGTYTETIYEEANSGMVDAEHSYSATINYLVDKNSILDPSTSRLRTTVKIQAASGDHHEIAAGIPHETHIPTGSFTATLLFTSPPILDTVRVYSPREIHPSNYQRPALTEDQKARLLHRLGREYAISVGGRNS